MFQDGESIFKIVRTFSKRIPKNHKIEHNFRKSVLIRSSEILDSDELMMNLIVMVWK